MISDILIGKTLEEVKKSTKDTSYVGIFDAIKDNLGMVDNEDILQGSNELKALKYDDVFIMEIIIEDWVGDANLTSYGICELSFEKIKNTIYNTILKFYEEYFSDNEELIEEKENMANIIRNINNETTLWDIDDIVYSDIPVNIFYKKNNKVVTLYHDGKILDCLK